jgi:hypothetical protein
MPLEATVKPHLLLFPVISNTNMAAIRTSEADTALESFMWVPKISYSNNWILVCFVKKVIIRNLCLLVSCR